MNYPIWELITLNSGTLVAFISVTHAYIAHLAVGGGLFLWLTDLKGERENNPNIRSYVKKHTWFFLLLTMVFGGISGVGIWFIIALANPAATSSLIHTFVFAWAIEWVFFAGEIVALLIYHYKFENLTKKARLNIACLYALFAWLSMVVINGILAFMLTPGAWLQDQSFWSGFFNPTYFPSLFFRTCAAIMFAGLFGYVTVIFSKESEFRTKMLRYCTKWLLFPIPGIALFGIWYYFATPSSILETTFSLNPQTGLVLNVFIISSILIFLLGLFFTLRCKKPIVQKILVFVLILIGQGWYGGYEYMREYARKPFIIYDYMYSTSIYKADMDKLNKEGVLAHAKWSEVKKITPNNKMKAGKELFNIQCLACHSIGGFKNDIIEKTRDLTYMGMQSQLYGQGKVLDYMPPFAGTVEEREALAAFIIGELHGRELVTSLNQFEPKSVDNEIPPFNHKKDDYVLLAWNDLGMHCISDSDPWFIFLPPANSLEAILIKRGETPELVTEGVEIKYQVEKGFENPSKHVKFWEYAEKYFGKAFPENIGINGKGLSGVFEYDEANECFAAHAIPVTPYTDDNKLNPYPRFYLEAVDKTTQKVITSTKVVAPVSTEMGCRNCHGGGWRKFGVSGVADETAINILKVHDRISGTNLYQSAQDGQPQLCQSCHADPAVKSAGILGHNNFSTAIHGWHANYMNVEGGKACVMCHPASSVGNTRCNRGIHPQLGLNCTHCHGSMNDHSIGLLNNQPETRSSARLKKNISAEAVENYYDIQPREPWIQEPDCLTCHQDFEKPGDNPSGFNQWNEEFAELYRVRTDDAGIRCIACHNSPHSEYPARNAFGKNRDNTQPMQYSGKPFPIGSDFSCSVCHKIKMEDSIHHPNMERMFRNKEIAKQSGLLN